MLRASHINLVSKGQELQKDYKGEAEGRAGRWLQNENATNSTRAQKL